MSASSKVLVMGFPEKVTRDKVMKHFQNSSDSGGGEIKSLIYPVQRKGKAAAVVEFQDEAVAASLLSSEPKAYRGKWFLTVLPFENELFENATAEFDTAILKKHPSLKQLVRDSDVKTTKTEGKTAISGDWYKINFIAGELQKLVNGSDEQTFKNATLEAKRQDKKTDVEPVEGVNSDDSYPLQAELPKSETPMQQAMTASLPTTDGAHCETFDGSLFSYVYLTRNVDVEAILYDCEVVVSYFRDSSGDDCVLWRSDTEGISRFRVLFDEARDKACQEFYDIPPYYEGYRILEMMKVARRQNPLVKMALLKGQFDGKILCIGENEGACNKAFSDFQSASSRSNYETSARTPTSEMLFSRILAGGIKFCICRGDIAKQDTKAIVNAANRRLANGAGVTGAIYSAGGYELERECSELVRRRRKPLDIGEVVHTGAYGQLECLYVLHVAGPMWSEIPWRDKKEKCQKIMNNLCWELIKYANETLKITSLALPAIGTGIYGIPMEVFCQALLHSLTKLHSREADGKCVIIVKEIRLVNYDYTEANELVRIIRERPPPRVSESAV